MEVNFTEMFFKKLRKEKHKPLKKNDFFIWKEVRDLES